MITTQQLLTQNLQRLLTGDMSPLMDLQFCNMCSTVAVQLINNPYGWSPEQQSIADTLIRISNIAYNCTTMDVLPLDDGVYDQLLVCYKRYNPNYQVGATEVKFKERPQNETFEDKVICSFVDTSNTDKLYVQDLHKQHTSINEMHSMNTVIEDRPPITKRLINTTHKYPQLVGTLDKCKFVLNYDAKEKGMFDKPSVAVFERDYIHKCLEKNIITPIEKFEMVAELKYDGVSVEAEVQGDTIISALSRGDTADNVATDLTPIFGGYKFPYAGSVPKDTVFGIKFEAVITKRNLELLGQIRGKTYKNCRNAIIGLLGASDAYKFIDYITLIPLSCSLEFERLAELNFLNNFYHSGERNRFCLLRGNYREILYQVKQFVESAEYIRPILPYLIDGVVVSFTNKQKIRALGRENSINKYQMAIKFNPSKNRTIFLGYSYTIGKTGDVTPMVHFKPCEFLGAIHTKQSIHSYERFRDLELRIGDEIDVDYVNDVITYVTKPDTQNNRMNVSNRAPEPFIQICPYCGSKIVLSETRKSAKCPNVFCHERLIMRMVDMLDRLGFKDFGEERIRALNLTKFADLFKPITYEQMNAIGPNMTKQFLGYVDDLKTSVIPDYKLMSAMGFEGMADEKWKLILKHITLNELCSIPSVPALRATLTSIPKIGDKTVEAIVTGMNIYIEDIKAAIAYVKIQNSRDAVDRPRVAVTGFRDIAYIDTINNSGYDCSDKYTVTKNTYALIAANPNESSGKIKSAQKYGIPIYSKDEFLRVHNILL